MSEGLFPSKMQNLVSAVTEFTQQASKLPTVSDAPAPPRLTQSIESGEPDLVPEKKQSAAPVIEFHKGAIERKPPVLREESEWELLSEKISNCSTGAGVIFVPKAGSVRSITSIDHENSSSSQTTLSSVPFKIQRTLQRSYSNSTIDSQDNVLGPSGKGVLGVDYVEHIVLPTDTLQGICIAYKVSVANLRRANHFTGQLHSAPRKLLIPLSKQALRTGFIRVQDTDTKEYKLSFFQAEYPDINSTEAKAYLEFADWDPKEAVQSVKEDREWQKEDVSEDDFKAGQIGIKINFSGGRPNLSLKGAGQSLKRTTKNEKPLIKEKAVVHSMPPAIASKSVLPEDLYNVSFQKEPFPNLAWFSFYPDITTLSL
jgi:LysM repeat protein